MNRWQPPRPQCPGWDWIWWPYCWRRAIRCGGGCCGCWPRKGMVFFRHHNHTLNHNRNPPKEIKITMMITMKNVKPKPRRGGDGGRHGWATGGNCFTQPRRAACATARTSKRLITACACCGCGETDDAPGRPKKNPRRAPWVVVIKKFSTLRPDFFPEPAERIVVFVHDAFFQWNDRVVGDGDVFGADLGAALGDVAKADAVRLLQLWQTIFCVKRVHFQRGGIDQKARADEFVVLVVVAQNVADVLTEKTFDALAEFLHAVHVFLLHPP